jgi:sugar O-acyltransferase (sialic acid O-acetyltransferase NeuD family)
MAESTVRRIGIFGTSGMAREARDIAVDLGLSVVFVAYNRDELAACGESEEVILEADVERYADMPYVIGIGEGAVRRKVAQRFADKVGFRNLIHPAATFGKGQRKQVESRQGVIVCAGARLTSNIVVGDFTIFNINATVSHDCIIGDFVTVCPQACVLGNVEVKSGAWVGAGAIINQGNAQAKTTIGANAMIGSGAVVVRDCEADAVYVGVPARKIR